MLLVQYAHFIIMQTYELLYILPGTITEDEAKPIMSKVQEAVVSSGATDITNEHGGKNKLSYPMRHIRYGWFELVYFNADPALVKSLEAKLRIMPELLRAVIRLQPAGAARNLQNAFVPITRDQGRFDNERRDAFMAPAAASAPHSADMPPEPSVMPVETKVENQQLEDITKKLDEILEKDLANT